MASRQAAVAEYQATLEDLSFNSKPHINMLTMLAEENCEFSVDIVSTVEQRLLEVRLIDLIDSPVTWYFVFASEKWTCLRSNEDPFMDATTHLYRSPCLSVRLSSVILSRRHSVCFLATDYSQLKMK